MIFTISYIFVKQSRKDITTEYSDIKQEMSTFLTEARMQLQWFAARVKTS